MNAEFNWWLLIVGLVVGAGLVWLIVADSNRRDADVTEEELPVEASWIAATLAETGRSLAPDMAEDVLRLHREYLAKPPPDEPADDAYVEAPAAQADVPVDPEPPVKPKRRRTSVSGDDAGV